MSGVEPSASVAEAVRALVLHVVTHVADPETTSALAVEAEALADRLEVATAGLEVIEGGHPVAGVHNPIAGPLVDGSDGPMVVADATFTLTHEGPPGCVHGGAIAAGFEHVVARAEARAGRARAPRTVRVRYRRPTLLGLPVRFEADPPSGSDGASLTARLVQNGDVTCEAEAGPPDGDWQQ